MGDGYILKNRQLIKETIIKMSQIIILNQKQNLLIGKHPNLQIELLPTIIHQTLYLALIAHRQ